MNATLTLLTELVMSGMKGMAFKDLFQVTHLLLLHFKHLVKWYSSDGSLKCSYLTKGKSLIYYDGVTEWCRLMSPNLPLGPLIGYAYRHVE